MSKHPELMTILDYIRFAATSFCDVGLYYGHGTTNAWDEAVALVTQSLHLSHPQNINILPAHLTKEEKDRLAHLISERIEKRIPIAYLTHESTFAGLQFYVDDRVLIPRSSIAELIENQFQPWIEPERVRHILDIGTGSGCIAIACAKAFPEAQIDATDISLDALSVAKINILRHQVESQVHLIESDLFQRIPQKQYDLIVSNPPYVSSEEMSSLPPEYRHEPKLGLHGGTQGLDIVLAILEKARLYLSPQGILVIEVGNSENKLNEMFPEAPFTWVEFENAEGGVFLLTASDLENFSVTVAK